MSDPLKILLVDDDPWFQKIFEKRFQKRFPQHTLHLRQTPEAPEGYDAYVIDNDFRGASHLSDLAKTIRSRKPSAVVFGLSGTLDEAKRSHFRQAGCQDAFEKATRKNWNACSRQSTSATPFHQESQPCLSKSCSSMTTRMSTTVQASIQKAIPNLTWIRFLEPETREGYDVYVIDNDFHGESWGKPGPVDPPEKPGCGDHRPLGDPGRENAQIPAEFGM